MFTHLTFHLRIPEIKIIKLAFFKSINFEKTCGKKFMHLHFFSSAHKFHTQNTCIQIWDEKSILKRGYHKNVY